MNDFQVALGRNGYLTPISCHEVAPGDTLAGVKEIQFDTRILDCYVANRTFLDVYTFYIPYRLLWSGFPDFLVDGSGTMPTAASPFYACFGEKQALDGTTVTPWMRYAYNAIWNAYFRPDDVSEVANSNGALQLCYFKTHDFYTADPEGTDQSYSIGSDVDSLRAAVAKDNFNKPPGS